MKKINPFLWFDGNAEEAVNFYTSVFDNARPGFSRRHGANSFGPEGSFMTGTFSIDGYEFMALNGGPMFKPTPAISFFVNCDTEEQINRLWEKLGEGGMVLLPLDKYPFSERYGWVQDKFGTSWQLIMGESTQRIIPCMLFTSEQLGHGNEAIELYTSLFPNSEISEVNYYGTGEDPNKEGTIKYAGFKLNGQEFSLMESGYKHHFNFSAATSFFVNCENQEEVDELWEKLSEGGEQQMCGWLQDRFGVSWQIIPTALGELMYSDDPERSQRVMQAMLQMRKIDIKELEDAYAGEVPA